jgi:TolA-binding protein
MKPLMILGLVGLVFCAIAIRRRRKKTPLEKIQMRADDALNDLEHRVSDIRKQAKRLRGDAKQKLQEQAHDLESQQRDLKKRLDDLSGDAQKLLATARAKAHA